MKSILLSIKPKWVAKILNGEKTIEIRKKFLADYVGWVYIYCTKDSKGYLTEYLDKETNKHLFYSYDLGKNIGFNGKVVARFWCDKVEEIRPFFHWCIGKETCLTRDEVLDYLDRKDKFVGNPKRQGIVYAIHISKLEIFDKPKEVCEFKRLVKGNKLDHDIDAINYVGGLPLTKAPQNYCYIEGEKN